MLLSVSRTTVDIDDNLIRKARNLTGLGTKRAIVHRALELLVRVEALTGILEYYGSGVWKGELKRARRNRRLMGSKKSIGR
jgi:Arc/MetJ family transcription regulator